MLHRIDQLEGALLDYAVMIAVGEKPEILDGHCVMRVKPPYDPLIGPDFYRYDPSKNWLSMGPLIQRERIQISPYTNGTWAATYWVLYHERDDEQMHSVGSYGSTPLIAACRAFVIGKLGPTIDIPEATP